MHGGLDHHKVCREVHLYIDIGNLWLVPYDMCYIATYGIIQTVSFLLYIGHSEVVNFCFHLNIFML